MMTIDDYKAWLRDCETIGIPAISLHLSAQILAVVYALGNNAQITHSPQLMADIDYLKRRFHLNGGETPDKSIICPLREYISQIDKSDDLPKWAENLFRDRYGIKLYK